MQLESRQRGLLQLLWSTGPLSRFELAERTGIRPNTIGSDTAALLDAGILRERPALRPVRGRPRTPLEIDPSRRNVVGLAIRVGGVQACRLNLLGQPVSEIEARTAASGDEILAASCELLRSHTDKHTLAIGLTTPGLVDPSHHSILFSFLTPATGGAAASAATAGISLQKIYDCAGDRPMVLENDMHALAARWLLTHLAEQQEDVLLIYFSDGELGAALLIGGKPNRGCVTGANELGHTRLPVETEKCFCGEKGCLERICSTPFLRGGRGKAGTLVQRAAAMEKGDAQVRRMVDLLGMGFGNAVNFIRPNRLVLVSELTQHPAFTEALIERIRHYMLHNLVQYVKVDLWDQSGARPAESAGWLALASIYFKGWARDVNFNGAETISPLRRALA